MEIFFIGLGFRPMPPEANLGSTLIWYKASKPENMAYWYKQIDTFLDGNYVTLFLVVVLLATNLRLYFSLNRITYNVIILKRFFLDYKQISHLENQIKCDYSTQKPEGKVCVFSAEDLGSCSPGRSGSKYGFPERKPCIFLKLNKVI